MEQLTLHRKIGRIGALLMIALLSAPVLAAGGGGQTAAEFLNIGLGARAASLGGANMALGDAATASYWNPAALGGAERTEFSISHFQWYQDLTVQQLAAVVPVTAGLSLGAHASMLQYGNIPTVDNNGIVTGSVNPMDWVAGVSAGYQFNDFLSVGATGKMVSQNLGDYSASSLAGDLSARVQFSRFSISAGVFNVGSPMVFLTEKEKLPTTIRAGVAVRPFAADLVGLIDVNSPVNGELSLRQGVEVGFSERYYLRGGFQQYLNSDVAQQLTRFNVGAGVKLSGLRFDYAYGGSGIVQSDAIHQFSLTLGLGHK